MNPWIPFSLGCVATLGAEALVIVLADPVMALWDRRPFTMSREFFVAQRHDRVYECCLHRRCGWSFRGTYREAVRAGRKHYRYHHPAPSADL